MLKDISFNIYYLLLENYNVEWRSRRFRIFNTLRKEMYARNLSKIPQSQRNKDTVYLNLMKRCEIADGVLALFPSFISLDVFLLFKQILRLFVVYIRIVLALLCHAWVSHTVFLLIVSPRIRDIKFISFFVPYYDTWLIGAQIGLRVADNVVSDVTRVAWRYPLSSRAISTSSTTIWKRHLKSFWRFPVNEAREPFLDSSVQ